MTEGSWESIALRFDAGTRRSDRGRTMIGGSPLRIVRLTDEGAAVVDGFTAGGPVGPERTRQRLARRLLDAGLVHPVPLDPPAPGRPPADLALVVPVRDHAEDLRDLLDELDAAGELPDELVVVDDGSRDPERVAAAVAGRGTLLRHERPRGPAAARNAGWDRTAAPLVAFVDADVTPSRGWLATTAAHFADPAVAAVAPRVRGRRRSNSALDRYEEHRSPLDLGPAPARVAPRSRVPYVPTAAIVYRRSVLDAHGGFDEALQVGEDVDLVWRVVDAGHTVRYEPAAVVGHRNRGSWPALAAQRFRYGSSTAALDRRHPGAVPPVELDSWSFLAWGLVVFGGRRGVVAGAATAAGTTVALVPKLRGRFDRPVAEAVRLGGLGHLWAGRWLAHAVVRAWLPLALVGSIPSRRVRRVTAASLVVPPLLAWREERPALDPIRWLGAAVLDDVSYGAGVWWGCWQERSWRALLPRLSRVPGLDGRREGIRGEAGDGGVPGVTP